MSDEGTCARSSNFDVTAGSGKLGNHQHKDKVAPEFQKFGDRSPGFQSCVWGRGWMAEKIRVVERRRTDDELSERVMTHCRCP